MLNVVRLTTVASLMLHLIFGCSLHHAASCEQHGHQHEEVGFSPQPIDVHIGQGCGRQHDHSHGAVKVADEDCGWDLIATAHFHSPQPCGENHPKCQGEIGCSFAPPSDVVLIIDVPLVAYLVYDRDPLLIRTIALAKRAVSQRPPWDSCDSLSHCAFFCTWLI